MLKLPPPQIVEAIDWLCEVMVGLTESRIKFDQAKSFKKSQKPWKEFCDYVDLKKEAKQELWRKIEKYAGK